MTADQDPGAPATIAEVIARMEHIDHELPPKDGVAYFNRLYLQVTKADRAPIQFALVGMNAHINHDLPFAVVQTCSELGLAPEDGSPQHADYQRVNAILGDVETQVAGWFETGLIADLVDVVPQDVDNALAL